MKKILFCIAIFFVFSTNNAYSNNIEKIDSLFMYHIRSLNDTINKYATSDEQKIGISGDDRIFVEMIDFIADFKFDQQGYTHQPMIDNFELKKIKEWYEINRQYLNWGKIQSVIETYNRYNKAYMLIDLQDKNSYDIYIHTLDSLELELKKLQKTNTFIMKK